MGYNGNHRKPYNVWKPSLQRRGMRMLGLNARKPRKYKYTPKNTSRNIRQSLYVTSYRYDMPHCDEKCGENKESTWEKIYKWFLVVMAVLTIIAVISLIVWLFGWFDVLAYTAVFILIFFIRFYFND